MSQEGRVAVVTDSVSSMRPEYPVVQKLGIDVLPVEIVFSEGNKLSVYSDFDITPSELYRRMRGSKQLPSTSGSITRVAIEAYRRLACETDSIISIHATARHSAAYDSAVNAARHVREEKPGLSIEVIDSQSISLGMWFLAEQAAGLAQQGAYLEEIKEQVLATVPKIGFLLTLATLDNAIKGGRVHFLAGYLATLLKIKPILGIIDGELKEVGRARTLAKAREEMINRVKCEKGQVVKMAVVHTNDLKAAEEVKQELAGFYAEEISVYEAGAALGVHGGEGAVAVIFQKA